MSGDRDDRCRPDPVAARTVPGDLTSREGALDNALRSALDLTRAIVEVAPLDLDAAALMVNRIGSLGGPPLRDQTLQTAAAIDAARARVDGRRGVVACHAIFTLVAAAEGMLVRRVH